MKAVNCLLGPLIWSFYPILASSERTWSRSDVLRPLNQYYRSSHSGLSRKYVNLDNCLVPLIWSFYPILFIDLQFVRELGQLFQTSHLFILSHPLHPPSGSTWTWQFFNMTSHLTIPSLPLQDVREIWQPFESSSYHPIPSSSSVSRAYVNLDQMLKNSRLIITFHPLLRLQAVREFFQLLCPLIWLSHPALTRM